MHCNVNWIFFKKLVASVLRVVSSELIINLVASTCKTLFGFYHTLHDIMNDEETHTFGFLMILGVVDDLVL